jgi:hypothetical protein
MNCLFAQMLEAWVSAVKASKDLAMREYIIQGTFGVIQGTFGVIQGTFGVIQGTCGCLQVLEAWHSAAKASKDLAMRQYVMLLWRASRCKLTALTVWVHFWSRRSRLRRALRPLLAARATRVLTRTFEFWRQHLVTSAGRRKREVKAVQRHRVVYSHRAWQVREKKRWV